MVPQSLEEERVVRFAPRLRGIVSLALAWLGLAPAALALLAPVAVGLASHAGAQAIRPAMPDRGAAGSLPELPNAAPPLRIEPAPGRRSPVIRPVEPRLPRATLKPLRPASPRIAVPPITRPGGGRIITDPRPLRPDPRGSVRLPRREVAPIRIEPRTRREPPRRPSVEPPRPTRPTPPASGGMPRAIVSPLCIGGTATGSGCLCADGSVVPALGQRTVRCPVRDQPAVPCPNGQVRVAGLCIDRDARATGAAGVCLYGTWRRGACTCPGGRNPQRLARRHYVCRPDFTCDPGWRRVGSRCLRVEGASSLPPVANPEVLAPDGMPKCAKGYRRRGDRCVKVTSGAD